MGAANKRTAVVSDYYGDPVNDANIHGLTGRLWQRVQSCWATRYGIPNGYPGASFTGYKDRALPFLSGSNLGGNANPYRNKGSATIESGVIDGPMGDPSRRIFAARLARSTTSGSGL